jgi:uncharacterized protein YoxC
MARALGVFKENALSKIRVEAESEEQRKAAEAERTRNDVEKQAFDREIDFAVSALAAGLERLAQGDLSRQIDTPFSGRLEQLRQDFNVSLTRLQDTLGQIRNNALSIQRSGAEMLQSGDALAKRTEQQASSLEETAAALDEITAAVQNSSARAGKPSASFPKPKRRRRKALSEVVQQRDATRWAASRARPRQDRRDHRGHRRHCLPDEPARAQRRRGSGPCGRSRQGLCRRRAGSARARPAFSQCSQGDQDAHRRLHDARSRPASTSSRKPRSSLADIERRVNDRHERIVAIATAAQEQASAFGKSTPPSTRWTR